MILLSLVLFVIIILSLFVIAQIYENDYEYDKITNHTLTSLLLNEAAYLLPPCDVIGQHKYIQSSITSHDWQPVVDSHMIDKVQVIVYHKKQIFIGTYGIANIFMVDQDTHVCHSLVQNSTPGAIFCFSIRSNPFTLFVAGDFVSLGTSLIDANNVAAWDGQSWHNINNGVPEIVRCMHYELSIDMLYMGGNFDQAVLVYNGVDIVPVGNLQNGFSSIVSSLVCYCNELYAGGTIVLNNNQRHSLIVFRNNVWQFVSGRPNKEIKKIIVSNGKLIMGGIFTACGPSSCVYSPNVAMFDGTSWISLGNKRVPGVTLNIDVDVFGRIYITQFDGNTYYWNGEIFLRVGSRLLGGYVLAMTIGGGDYIYVGGDFQFESVGGIAEYKIGTHSGIAVTYDSIDKKLHVDLHRKGTLDIMCTHEFGWLRLDS